MPAYYFRGSHPESVDLEDGYQIVPGVTYDFTPKDFKDSATLARLLDEEQLLEITPEKKKKEGES
jgi:hypothetical protein